MTDGPIEGEGSARWSQVEPTPAGLRDYLVVLWLRRWTVASIAGVALLVALVYSFTRPPVFVSAAEVLVQPVSLPPPQQSVNYVLMENELRIATSAAVVSKVQERLARAGMGPAPISVDAPQGTYSLLFQAASPDPRAAEATAQAYAEAYLDFRRESVTRSYRDSIAAIDEYLLDLDQQIKATQRRLEGTSDPERIASLEVRLAGLRSERNTQQLRRAELALGAGADVGQLLAPASPAVQGGPAHAKAGLFGLFAGLALGVGAAFVQHRLDERRFRQDELEESAGAPALALVPPVERGPLVLLDAPDSEAADAYRSLRARLLFMSAHRPLRSVMVTSPHPGEGKTTTAANLAVALAKAGKDTILVGADLRRAALATIFENLGSVGLTNALAGEVDPLEALVPSLLRHLRILPSGPTPSFPAEALGSEAMGEIVAKLEGEAQFVVLDTTPVLATADALNLAPHVDAALLVVEATRSLRPVIERAAEDLRSVGTSVVGVVLTNFDPHRFLPYQRAHRSSYRYHYAGEEHRPSEAHLAHRRYQRSHVPEPDGARGLGRMGRARRAASRPPQEP